MWNRINNLIIRRIIMFNENSGLVKIWFGAVLNGTYKYQQVPALSNLRDEVGTKLTDIGYDISVEGA